MTEEKKITNTRQQPTSTQEQRDEAVAKLVTMFDAMFEHIIVSGLVDPDMFECALGDFLQQLGEEDYGAAKEMATLQKDTVFSYAWDAERDATQLRLHDAYGALNRV